MLDLRLRLISALTVMVLLAACAAPVTPTTTPSPRRCGPVELSPELPDSACAADSEAGTLIQSQPGQSLRAQVAGASLTLDGLLLLVPLDDGLRALLLDGAAVISADGASRILNPRTETRLLLDDAGELADEPSPAQPLDLVSLDDALRDELDLDQYLPAALPPTTTPSRTPTHTLTPSPTATATQTPTATRRPRQTPIDGTPGACMPREDWTETYTVAMGDNLSRVAGLHGLEPLILQEGNCLDDPDLLTVGTVLRLPAPTATPTPRPGTPTPSAVLFRADRTTLSAGECTMLRWDVYNVEQVTIDGALTTGQDVLRACPAAATTYTLRVRYPDGSETVHEVTLLVTPD